MFNSSQSTLVGVDLLFSLPLRFLIAAFLFFCEQCFVGVYHLFVCGKKGI